MECRMVEIASGDDRKMERMGEICLWLQAAATEKVFTRLTMQEDDYLTPSGVPVGSLSAFLWSMEEAESVNLIQARKWREFRSRLQAPIGLQEDEVGVVMALAARRCQSS